MTALTHCLLTTDQMGEADRLTIEGGLAGLELMENAGRACVAAIIERISQGETLVLCGPGNNGGDGFVVARRLRDLGWPVTVALTCARDALSGDAAEMAERWGDEIETLDGVTLDRYVLVVDALFGAGLSRPLEREVEILISALNITEMPVCAIDVPSGVDGSKGTTLGEAVRADFTVTFFRRKPAHVLLPGSALSGEVIVADIGIRDDVLEAVSPNTFMNDTSLWREHVPEAAPDGHKYHRGHAVVVSGDELHTGAARLGARAALRAGAGLVTVASPVDAVAINAVHLTAIMLAEFEDAEALASLLGDDRLNAVLIGPGAGVGDDTKDNVRAVLRSGAAVVLDADALTSFQHHRAALFDAIVEDGERPVIMTPHGGEFVRLFPVAEYGAARLQAARKAAKDSGATIILKGPDTVIASPDGRAAINDHASPWLATAGSGDVLAGIATGLLAQGVPPFEAASMAVWLHGDAGIRCGVGQIAEDLTERLPEVMAALLGGD